MKATAILILVVVVAGTACASMLEIDLDLQTGNETVSICLDKALDAKIGVFGYASVTEEWSEAYVGLTYAPIPELQIAYGVGKEMGGDREGGWIWAGKDKVAILYLFEDGTSGRWHRLDAKYAVTERLGLGITDRTGFGDGFLVEQQIEEDITIRLSAHKELTEVAIILAF